MSQPADLTDSGIVMAEQSSHDVVNQTLSGGEPSPSDVPASTKDKISAGGDVGETRHTTATTQTTTETNDPQSQPEPSASDSSLEKNETENDSERPSTEKDISKQGPGPVATRALEMNGVASVSDAGEDTASQGGSESDASRTDGKRVGSKKPTTFKPVSFAKFSVPKAPGALATAKTSDKAPSSLTTPLGGPLQSSRPRLVAKTTSSLRDSLSKSGTGAGKAGAGGPDPNQVWNKNRPVQPTPPKHLTDEELKQQYGIHMTSRIQEDGGGTEAKWADIDDDEDDWAPETIEWTDGTKTSLTTHTEAVHAPGQDTKTANEAKVESPAPEQAPAIKEVTKIVTKPTTTIGPNPTVLRLGANAERQAKSATILSKGPNDKASLSSTSPAPPSKSPWAPLPPVEKVSPVMPPVQVQPPGRAPVREHQVSEPPTGTVHPKEIAADDFNRSWKDTHSGTTRELYNSRSGRYEPVPERKAPWRAEQQGFRPSSLLQRPTPGEQAGPAEPSPAFQTHRSSGQDAGHWTRRRTSSNVSGGSGSFGRRMSIGRPDGPHRTFEARRGSQVNGIIDPSLQNKESVHPKDASMHEASSARHPPGPTWPPRAAAGPPDSVANAHRAASQSSVPPAPEAHDATAQAPQEDPVAMQERIMKEKRLEARQRRLEQEEKEEAAKRERIRQKLEALGPPPEKPKSKKESLEGDKAEAKASLTVTQAAQSPPKPPVPEPTGEPKQYGMMKVHHPDAVKKLVAANEKGRAAERSAPTVNARRPASPARDPKLEATTGPQELSDFRQSRLPEKLPESIIEEPSSQWKSNLSTSSSYSPWSSNTKLGAASSSIANPWKPLSNDKTLGNGIFDQTLGGFPSRDISLRGPLGLDQPPISSGPQPFSAPSRPQPESTSISPLPPTDVRHAQYDSMTPAVRPGPIGPPSVHQSHWQQEPRVTGTTAWNNFHAVAAKREAEENEKLLNEMNTMRDSQPLHVTFNETWRQVRTGDQSGQRQVVGIHRPTDTSSSISNHLPGFDHPVATLPFADTHARPLSSVPVRSSRFFPQATEQYKRPAFEEDEHFRSPSPPPPEELSSHPVYMSDSTRPLVHLPAPKPIVKLPPKIVAPPPPPTFASMVAAPPRVPAQAQPVSTATSWQEKINCLFGKKTVHEKKNALAVTSASKEPLDVQLHIAAVSVSLPLLAEDMTQVGDGIASAKQVEETEEIFEDREAGSLPVVRVPNAAPPAAWHAAPAPSQSRLRFKSLKPMQIHSIEPYILGLGDRDSSGNFRVSIRFPGAIAAKTVTLPKKAGSQNPRQRGPSSFKPRKNTKAREGPGNSNTKKTATTQQNGGSASSPRHQPRNTTWAPRTISASH
ncbi:uncharacterized protein NFIA_082240 [Aspergillus fischeri NRRL 181]|uniref:Uncharacterized protein n=1 Tax=Neosartorya fischeri (strain ATCC 1020 / DSM 3700 / CBS 544.65 / FGSC A1164 / JCM 1740 / NRRL 181 / WB 181) TaxID=331117 RepID=A1DFX0_NEOFI|nr:conserved hypothetical protein [Aspergillus fischeri NRRL 181]EAW18277.1 conserved hypothetical protein [Aspergillus fischeri NRRL 181]KAG2024989.1 hypothetical protein GB937_003213 [Aspergillus fischeri]